MLCSICNKNAAVIFANTVVNGKNETKGYCYSCAQEKGINPLEVLAKQAALSPEEIENMSKQFEQIMGDISENIDNDNINEIEEMPISSIISTVLGGRGNNDNTEERKKVKIEKKVSASPKKKRALDIYGTNLTVKAHENKIDAVIGRDKEIVRITQILNRRSKNNPCLIGEPGVGKTAIAQGLAIKISARRSSC